MIHDPAPSYCLGDLAEGSIRVLSLPHVWVCLGVVLWCLWGEPLSLVYLRVVDTTHLPKWGGCGHLGFPLCFSFWKVLLPNSHFSSTTPVGGGSSCPQSSGPDAPSPSFHDQALPEPQPSGGWAPHGGVCCLVISTSGLTLDAKAPPQPDPFFWLRVSTSTNTQCLQYLSLLPMLWAPPPESLPGCSLWSCVCVSHLCVLGDLGVVSCGRCGPRI